MCVTVSPVSLRELQKCRMRKNVSGFRNRAKSGYLVENGEHQKPVTWRSLGTIISTVLVSCILVSDRTDPVNALLFCNSFGYFQEGGNFQTHQLNNGFTEN